ncbi:MAG TPA: hypothetical protein PKE47_11125, partial [Verrucomicrobiota bacterium]|nr:hypothetical protein [Verrucomicrobiota bacterium]
MAVGAGGGHRLQGKGHGRRAYAGARRAASGGVSTCPARAGGKASAMRLRMLRRFPAAWAMFLAFAAGAEPVTLETFMRRAGYHPVRLQERDFQLLAKGTLDGRPATMLVDSGCSLTTVNLRQGQHLPDLGTLGARIT